MKTMRVLLACGVALVAVLDAASAQEHPGARSYERVCQACHGPQGQGDLAPPLVPMPWETNYVMAIVREGYGQMPPISTRELDDQEVAQAVEYLRSVGETPAMQGGGYQGPRAADGHPDLSGIWQVVNSASWNLEAHNAVDGEPAGLSVVVGDTIPYQLWAATLQQENYENRLTADPMRQCFLAGVPRITYMPFPFQMIQTPDHMVITYELAHAVRIIYTDGESASAAERLLDGRLAGPVGRRYVHRRYDAFQRPDVVRRRGELPAPPCTWWSATPRPARIT